MSVTTLAEAHDALLVDLDGTITDSFAGIEKSFRHALAARGAHDDVDRAALAVLDGIDHEVAQDALDAPRVDLGNCRLARGLVDGDLAPPGIGDRGRRVDDPVDDGEEVDGVLLEHRRTRVVAADLEQVGEQLLEAVELVVEELRGAPGDRVHLVAR